jgi:hypothetical protein
LLPIPVSGSVNPTLTPSFSPLGSALIHLSPRFSDLLIPVSVVFEPEVFNPAEMSIGVCALS